MAPETLVQTRTADVVIAHWSRRRDLVRRLCALRASDFDPAGTEDGGLDRYDEAAQHLIAMDSATGHIMAGLRLGFGEDIKAALGPEGLNLLRYWRAPDASVWRKWVEVGRFWVAAESRPQPRLLFSLWGALGEALRQDRRHTNMVVGTVALHDYPADAASMLAWHMLEFHSPERFLLAPRYKTAPACKPLSLATGRPLQALQHTLAAVDPGCGLPPLLRLYLTERALLIAPPAYDATGRKLVIAVCMPVETFKKNLKRYVRHDGR